MLAESAALGRWCEAQPDLVPYRGSCLVRHAEILQLHGAWVDAATEAERAREVLSRLPGRTSVGAVSSSRCTNEEIFLTQKFARAVLGNNNIDNCARICHSPRPPITSNRSTI